MDSTEQVAHKFLTHLALGEAVYEPDGNVPPDFLVAGRIAVEVRRLNQHDASEENPRGLEEDQIPLLNRVRRLLISLGPPRNGRSWFVSYRIGRPVERWRTLEPHLKRIFEEFASSPVAESGPVELGSSLKISLHPASHAHAEMFVLGGYSDRNSGGWLLSEMQRDLSICIEEKTRKVRAVRARYPEWWLVLVDHIALGLSDFDRDLFHEHVKVRHNWDRLILVDRRDHTRAFDIVSSDVPDPGH